MMQPVSSPTTRSSSAASSSQFIRMPFSSIGPSAAAEGVAAVSAPSLPHPRPSVPASPESLVLRNLKKRIDRLDLNARTPSSSSFGLPMVASAGTGTGTGIGPHDGGAATAAINQPTSTSSTHSNHNNNNHDNSYSGKKNSRRHKKDRDWKRGPPATLAPLSQPPFSSLQHSTRHSRHHSNHHHKQEKAGAGAGGGNGSTQHSEGIVSGHAISLAAGGGEGGSATEDPSGGGRKATGKGISGLHSGGEIAGGGGGKLTEATKAVGSSGGGGGREGRRRRKKEKERGGIGRKRTTSVNSHLVINNHNNSGQAPPGVGVQGCGGAQYGVEYQRRPAGTESGIGMGATPCGGMGYSSSVAGIQEPVSSPGMQHHHHQDYQPQSQSQYHHGYHQQQQQQKEQQQQHQQSYHEHLHEHLHQQHQQYEMNQQMRQSVDMYSGQHYSQQHPGQQQQGELGASDKTIRSSFLQGIKTHALQPNQLTHLTLLRYEFLMNEFVEMMRLLPAVQVLDLDVASVPSCTCRTFPHPYGLYHHRQQKQHASCQHRPSQYPSLQGEHFRASPYTETPYSWHSSQNDDSDNMDVDYEQSNSPSAATLCSNCIRREGLFRRSQGTSTAPAGPQDQFPTVRSLTFRGTAIVPELLALFPNLETLALEEMRYKTPAATIGPPSIPGDALFHGSAYSQAHSRRSSDQSQGEFGSSSFYTDSGDDSLDATASLSLEAGLPSSPSRQSVMISELAMMLKNHCPLLTRLVLNEPLLVEDLSREQLRLQNNSLSSSSISPSPSPSQSYIYPLKQKQQQLSSPGRVQDRLALLLQVIPRLKQFVVHSRVVAKCPQLLDTLLEYHHPHLVSFQVLDDSQDMSHYPSIQNPNVSPVLPRQPQHHAFYSTQDIYDQQSPHQQQQLYEQLGHQYNSTFVTFGSESSAMQQQQQQYAYPGGGHGGHGGDLPSSPSAQSPSLLYQTLQTQHHLQQVQRQHTMLHLQASSFRILEACPNLQVFESKIPLPLQQLIGSVPRWACGSEITVLWLEIEELTGNSGLDPEEEEVMQMFVRSLFKGSRPNTASSSPPQETNSSGSGEGGSSRPTTVSPSPPPPIGVTAAVDIVSNGSSSFADAGDKATAPAATRLGSHLVEVRPSGTVLSSLGSAGDGGVGEPSPSPSPSSVLGLPPGQGAPLSSDAWTSQGIQTVSSEPAVNVAPSPAAGVRAGMASGWIKPLLPPPPPLTFTSPAKTSSSMGGGASYASGSCQIEGIERLVALQFLVEHQLVYLPKLDRFLMGSRTYTIPTRERVL
ncbi:hypothetical protein BGZ88_001738 [Linnemannia elongata]|nr:hypothetical protein BGZ88_001738 [Linnemannia elongata]